MPVMFRAIVFALLVVSALAASPARAGYEYATPIGDCQRKLDRHDDGKPLRILPGTNRFEVFGNAIDFTDPATGLRTDGGNFFTARILLRRGGPENLARGCGAVGSAVVEVSKPVNAATAARHDLHFRMPFGDESRLALTVQPFPNYRLAWTGGGRRDACLLGRSGSLVRDSGDTRATLVLSPGGQVDSLSCTGQTVLLSATPINPAPVDMAAASCSFVATGLASWASLDSGQSGDCRASQSVATVVLRLDAVALRRLRDTMVNTITLRAGNPELSSTVATLVVQPAGAAGIRAVTPLSQALVSGAAARFQLSLVGDVDVVTWRIARPGCFTQELAATPYDPSQPYQYLAVAKGATVVTVSLRSTSAPGCASSTTPIQHVFEAWAGDGRIERSLVASTATPGYARASVTLVQQL